MDHFSEGLVTLIPIPNIMLKLRIHTLNNACHFFGIGKAYWVLYLCTGLNYSELFCGNKFTNPKFC